ncbi:MAG: hypothetical protein Q8Q35_04730 [Nanoarchaeota archaeon]|nr:hypothetical protein [Nanoarchaeota archaeon]
MKRGKVYHFLEKSIDWLIFPTLIILLAIIIIELFFQHTAEQYHTILLYTDYSILALFSVDLFFKYRRAKNIKYFLKTSWLDIIAIFPFFLIFRAIEPIIAVTEFSREAKNVQLIFHESLEVSKETSKIVKEVEAAGKISRARLLTSVFRSLGRTPRFLKAVAFYEEPTGTHHLKKPPGKKVYNEIKEDVEEGIDTVEDDINEAKDLTKSWFKKK